MSVNKIVLENVELIFMNLRGMPDQYNATGKREFSIKVDEKTADVLRGFNLNPKQLKPLDPEDPNEPPMFAQKVHASWKIRPPMVKLITATNIKNPPILAEEQVGMLDDADIVNVDVIIYPSEWFMNKGKPQETSGWKAYLHSMYVTIQEDPLMAKYAQLAEEAG